MKRALTALAALAAAAFTALALAVPAGAATSTDVFRYKSLTANATWSTTMATPTGGISVTDTYIEAYKSNQGSYLYAAQVTVNYDAGGNYLSETFTRGTTWSTLSFSIGQSLASASLSVTDLAGTKDYYDSQGLPFASEDVTIGAVNAAWTAQGKASREMTNNQYHTEGYTYTNHSLGTSRPATATGTFGGSAFSADQLVFCGLGDYSSGTITINVGH
jgi:hypothetical protein